MFLCKFRFYSMLLSNIIRYSQRKKVMVSTKIKTPPFSKNRRFPKKDTLQIKMNFQRKMLSERKFCQLTMRKKFMSLACSYLEIFTILLGKMYFDLWNDQKPFSLTVGPGVLNRSMLLCMVVKFWRLYRISFSWPSTRKWIH